MAALKDVIKAEYEVISDGMAWVVIYKNGRSWESATFWEEDNYGDCVDFCKEDIEEMKTIAQIDSNAICINGYQMGFGYDLSRAQTENKVLWMYSSHLNQLRGDFISALS